MKLCLFRKKFGPKGYGFGGGAGTLSMDDGQGYKTNPNEVGSYLKYQKFCFPAKGISRYKIFFIYLRTNS